MNTKTLISTLALTLALGTLALPGTAAARDYDRGGDRQEQHRDNRDHDRGDSRRHDYDRGRQKQDRYEYRRYDNGHHYGQIHWAPYVPKYRHHERPVYTTHHSGGYYDPNVILRIETHW